MYNAYETYPYPCFYPMYNPYNANYYRVNLCGQYPCSYYNDLQYQSYPTFDEMRYYRGDNNRNQFMDYGPEPFVINIDEATLANDNFRTALWTGENLQLTLMSIDVGEDIGLEIHPNLDQFIRIEEGEGLVKMGDDKCNLDFERRVYDDFAIIIPAGKWHNLINTGDKPIKLYSIYAPPEHPYGTTHETKADSLASEE